jgi:chondroitin-sulfate-ABC endolyase/exolyase
MMMRSNCLIGLFLVGSLAASVLGKRAVTMALTNGYSFEDRTVPAEWQADGLDLSISDRHFKDGTHSLAWHWHAGQKLLVNRPRGLEEISRLPEKGICVWIYNESPDKGALTFRFGSDAELNGDRPAPYQFQFGLNFRGWRAAWV